MTEAVQIRHAVSADIPDILAIYADARSFMKESGNPTQWAGVYPAESDVLTDLQENRLYICYDEAGLLGVFCFFVGEDETYKNIYEGNWLSSEPYGVLHRVALSKGARGKGISKMIFDFAHESCGNVRIDTHRDNTPMRRALEKNEFVYCGIINLTNGEERLAYQKA